MVFHHGFICLMIYKYLFFPRLCWRKFESFFGFLWNPRPALSGLIYFTFIVFVTLFCEFSVGDDTPGATA